MTKNERLTYLMRLVMAEKASDTEHSEMLQLINEAENETLAKEELLHAYRNAENLADIHPHQARQILEAILQSDKQIEKPNFKLHHLRNLVAAAVILVCLSVGFYLLRNKIDNQQPQPMAQHDVLPGGNRAILTLADGKIISLSDADAGKIAKEAGLIITKKADGQISYEVVDNRQEIGGFNTIETPYGGKYEVVLQDGTKVTLNAGSKLTYPLAFDKHSRKVVLTGEAYFEVSKDSTRPFFVNTPEAKGIQAQEIKVLGTHFNVNAYEDEQAYITTLAEGSVSIATAGAERVLKPGQQSTVKQSIQVDEGNINAALAWKNDVFYFTDLPIQDMMRKLSRWYDIEVVYEGEIPSIVFLAQLSRKKKLSEVLEALEETNRVHFRIEGRKVFVKR